MYNDIHIYMYYTLYNAEHILNKKILKIIIKVILLK